MHYLTALVQITTGALVYALIVGSVQASAYVSPQELSVTASFAGKDSILPGEPIRLGLNRPLLPSEGRLAVLVGQTDLTNLFAITESGLNYGAGLLPLPAGESEVIVYLVSPANDWRELARFGLRVVASETNASPGSSEPPKSARRFGFDKIEIAPTFNIGVKSQLAETHFPEANRPERAAFADATLQGSLKTDLARGSWAMQNQFEIAGSSFPKEALRFNERGVRAPKVDLSSYGLQIQHGRQSFIVGHTTYGANRHLINNFASRGLTLTFPMGKRADFSVAALNGTNIVGWDNFFGIDNRRHQVLGGTLGFEIFPARRGGLRLEAGVLEGTIEPRSGFNQGRWDPLESTCRHASLSIL